MEPCRVSMWRLLGSEDRRRGFCLRTAFLICRGL